MWINHFHVKRSRDSFNNMIISLTGFMGCGKSSVGRKLSELLCCRFMDLDDCIVEEAGCSIPEIFAQKGEPAFRKFEKEVLSHIICISSSSSSSSSSASNINLGSNQEKQSNSLGRNDSDANTETTSKAKADLILALGGGAVMTEGSEEMVHEGTMCVYLKASVETLIEHLSGETDGRPMLSQSVGSQTAKSSSSQNIVSSGSQSVVSTSSQAVISSSTQSSISNEVETSPLRKRILELMSKRAATYERTAHIIIETDDKSVEEVAAEIVGILSGCHDRPQL